MSREFLMRIAILWNRIPRQRNCGAGLPVKKFFNTSGLLYKSMKLKDQLADMSLDEQIALLASNGMLVKRPIFITNGKICVGFKADEWKAAHRS